MCTFIVSLSSLQIQSSSHATPATVCISPLNLLIKLPNNPLIPNLLLAYLVPILHDSSAPFNIVNDSFLLGIPGFCDFSLTSLFIHLVGYLSVFCWLFLFQVGMHPKPYTRRTRWWRGRWICSTSLFMDISQIHLQTQKCMQNSNWKWTRVPD